jgi:uncharacterized membrane protein HdeD (DUF308 family)
MSPVKKHGTQAGQPAARASTSGTKENAFDLLGASGPFAESGALSALLAQNWWAVALRGVIAILFGIIAFLMPGATIGALVLLFAAYMLADGTLAIIAGVRAARQGQRWGALILEGIVDLIAAAIAILAPVATVVIFVYLASAWGIVTGVLMLAAVFRLRRTHGKWLLALSGIVSLAWGVLLLVAPITGAIVMTWWLAAYALVFGSALLVLAFRLRKRRHEASPADAHP